jgi:hypothetical protein
MLGIAGHAPEGEIEFEAAMALCRADHGLCWLIKESVGVTMNDLFNVARAEVGWQRYWMYHHPKPKQRERCCDAYLALAEKMQECEALCTDVGAGP